MPGDWSQHRWGDLATLEYGKALRKHERRDGPYQVFGTNGPIGYHHSYLVHGPGIIVGRKGAYREVHRSREPFFVIDTAFYLQPRPGVEFNIDWAYYQLKTVDINRLDSGGAIPSTSREAFYDVPVSVPPLATQWKIAAVLATYDELMENNGRRIEILEEMAQAIYREWFINFRYPGHEDVALVDSSLGPIPEGWEVARLGELADVNAESLRKNSAPAEINYVDISSVSPRSVDAITRMPFEEAPSRARRVVRPGDVIWSTVRPNRRSFALLLHPPANAIASTGFAVLTPTSVPYSYLYQAVGTQEFSSYLTNHAKGAAYPAVAAEDFEKALMVRPSVQVLHAFHDQVRPMLELVHVLAVTNRNLHATRDLLVPKLVSGEIDVSDLDIDTSWLAA